MMKCFDLKICFLAVCLVIFRAGSGSAITYSGKVLDIFGDNIATVQMSGGHPFASGDAVDLVYMAGALPMLVGQYEVTAVNGDVVLCKPVSQNMPPSVGMNIELELVRKASGLMDAKGFGMPDAVGQNAKDISGDAQVTRNFQDIALSGQRIEIKGEVLDVMGDDIKVAIKDNGTPRVGWQVDLFYLTAQGKELPVGTWEVKSVDGQTVTAFKVKGMGNARKGLKAVIHNGQARKEKSVENNVSPGPGGAGSIGELMGGPGVFKDVQANQPPPIELLGETPPVAPSGGNILNDFFASPPALPVASNEPPYFLGNPDAKTMITVFAGFECPFSKQVYPKLFKVIKPYLKNAKFVLRNYPLAIHKNAFEAIRASFAAGQQGKYWEMVDALFAEKKELNEKTIKQIVKKLGLDQRQFENDYDFQGHKVEKIVEEDMRLASQWGLRGTPSYYINGKWVAHNDVGAFEKELKASVNSSDNLAQIIASGVEKAGEARNLRKYWLGVEVADNSAVGQELPGVTVLTVLPNSAAQGGGLQKGDVIYSVNGTGVNDVKHFISLVNHSNGKVCLKMQRNNKRVKKTIRPDEIK